jgi:hypothetical protein
MRIDMRMLVRKWKTVWRSALGLALLTLVGGLGTVILAADTVDWPGTSPENLSHSPLNRTRFPSIATSESGKMVVVWSDVSSIEGEREIWAVISSDDGRTWPDPPNQVAFSFDKDLQWPGSAIVGDRCFVSWSEETVVGNVYEFRAYETEIGSGTKRSVPGSLGYWDAWPRLYQDDEKLYMVVHGGGSVNDRPPNILYATRYLTASQWTTATVVYTHTGALGGSFYPSLAIEPGGDTLHLVWEERLNSDERSIFYMEGDATGPTVSWSPAVTLSTGITLSVWPSVETDSGGNVYVAWGEQVEETVKYTEHYIRFRRWDGDGWTTSKRIDPNPVRVNEQVPTAVTLSTALVEEDGYVRFCVAWHGFREGDTQADEEILLSCSSDQGATWTPVRNMSRTPGDESNSIFPSITFDRAGDLHGVWQERVVGGDIGSDYQIYHTRRLDKSIYLPLVLKGS